MKLCVLCGEPNITFMLRLNYFLFFCILSLSVLSQEKELFRVMFWNVENLFDTERDSLKQDQEFTPASIRGWNTKRYKKKMVDVARVITAVGEWEPPALVGLCEVENDRVLHYLTRYSPLKSHDYRYIMTASEDLRGIDVALLYQKDKFKLLKYNSIRPNLGPGERPTRDILHVTGMVPTKDTLDVFVVHAPSRSGGERESEPKRLLVAQLLRNTVDSLMQVRQNTRVLIMGDFNDYPQNKSIKEVLGARPPDDNKAVLYHLLARKTALKSRNANVGGSYKYQGEWGLLDHFMVSGKLLESNARIRTDENKADVVCLPFLLIEDEKFGGVQPFRTYNGMKYQGGYSDHLPVRVDFELFFD